MTVTDSPAVWRAVAHPVRRRLIELLAERPRTSGDLAGSFPITRFAVMKHLAVLERSGLIAVHRDGRLRWNTLTTASALDLVAPSAAKREFTEERVAGQDRRLEELTPFRVEQRVVLDTTPARVFDGLTFNISAWWGAPYLRSHLASNIVLEPQLGGRLYEEWGHRQGFIRGIVTAIRQDERLEVTGRIAGSGPLQATLEIGLVASERGTRLMLLHRGVTEHGGPASTPRLYAEAWTELIAVRLKAFLEDGVRSGIAERPPSPEAMFGWF